MRAQPRGWMKGTSPEPDRQAEKRTQPTAGLQERLL